jgi:hypothetical protein
MAGFFPRLTTRRRPDKSTNTGHIPTPGGTPPALPPPLRPPPNQPSGDNFENKPNGAFHVWSVNANGISSKDNFAELHSLCITLKRRSVDAIAIQEPNTEFMKANIRDKYYETFKEHFGLARVITATSCIDAPPHMETWRRRARHSRTLVTTHFQSIP